MGAGNSVFSVDYKDALELLNGEEQAAIAQSFRTFAGQKGKKVDRPGFSKLLNTFKIPAASCDRLFEAFDRKQTGFVDLEEFICGFAVLQHGTFKDKCKMLFRVFNLDGDEGVSREELTAVLSNVIKSATSMANEQISQADVATTVQRIVETAFKECDISHTGTLLPAVSAAAYLHSQCLLEFEYWVRKNPAVIEPLFGWLLLDNEEPSDDEEQVDSSPPAALSLPGLSEGSWSSVEKSSVRCIWPVPDRLREAVRDRSAVNMIHESLLCNPVVKFHHVQSNATLSKEVFGDAGKVSEEIRSLVDAERYNDACWLTGEILLAAGNTVSPYLLQLWTCRFSLMCYLGMFDSVATELEGFGSLDKVNLFYEYWADSLTLKTGSFVPYSLRVLHAQIPLMQVDANPAKALDRVYALKTTTEKILTGLRTHPDLYGLQPTAAREADKLWSERLLQVCLLVVQSCVALKDFELASEELHRMCSTFKAQEGELNMLLSRLYLTLGDVERASQLIQADDSHSHSSIHQCFLPMFKGNTHEGLSLAREAIKNSPEDPLVVNNYAVSLFHAQQPMEAVKVLEAYVLGHSPHKALMDNLSLAYEVESLDPNVRKQLIQAQLAHLVP